jgi:hypothetical protein
VSASGIQAVSSVIVGFATVVLVVVTIKYVILTRKLANVSESQLKFQIESDNLKKRQDIIDNSLIYVYGIQDDIDHLRKKHFEYDVGKAEFPFKSEELQRVFLNELRIIIDGRKFSKVMLIAAQLKRIQDSDLWKDLEELHDIYEKLLNVLMLDKGIEDFNAIEKAFKAKMKDYVIKCLDLTKLGGA